MRKVFSVEYYTAGEDTTVGVESYYLDGVTQGEPPGVWLGHGAAGLGLSGEVVADDMHTLFNEFEHPHTGERVGNRPAKRKELEERVSSALAAEPGALPERQAQIRRTVEASERTNRKGIDATFGVAKSVSVAHTAAWRAEIKAIRSGDLERAEQYKTIRSAIESAIADANAAGIAAMEQVATARTGGGSGAPTKWVKAEGLTVASFFQHTNRSIEPHLHDHNVVLNRVLCPDGKYRALDGEDFYQQRFGVSAVVDRVLMERLARLGFQVRLNADGTARELTIVRPEISEHFSGRTQQVTKAMRPLVEAREEALGRALTNRENANIHRFAQRSTRDAKVHGGESVEERILRGEAELIAETGYTLDGLADLMTAHLQAGPVEAQEWSPSAVLAEAVAAAAEKSATWGRADLKMEIELRLPVLGVDDDQVPVLLDALTATALASEGVVQVTGHTSGEYARPSATLYASADTLIAEKALRDLARQRSGHALDPIQLKAWLDEHAPTLGADQRAVVEGIATTDAAVSVVVGPAGSGKSFTAGALAAAWHAQTAGQGRVVGLTTTEVATKVLVDDGITASRNISQWLKAQDALAAGSTRPDHQEWALGPRDVVMVDEASMVSTAHLDAIRSHVSAAGARIALTGDPRQLASVEAGGVMDLLDGHAATYTLTDIRRFNGGWERGASLRLRAGDPDALVEYDKHGRLIGVETLDDAITAAARAAVADRMDERTTVVVASSNELAASIACQVRDRLVGFGLVACDGVLLGRDGNTGGVGDVVMCRRNDYRVGVTNRAQYRILDTTGDGGLVVRELPRPGQHTPVPQEPVEIPAAYVGEDVQLGYAATVHAAEGLTVDNGHCVSDGRDDAAAQYVAITRGRQRNTVYVPLAAPGYQGQGETGPEAKTGRGGTVRAEADTERATALSVLVAGLAREDTARLAATVAAEQDAERSESMAALVGILDAETRQAVHNRLERHLDDLTADGILPEQVRGRLAGDDGTRYLARLLRALEQGGDDPRAVLTDAVTRGKPLDDAESPARVLSYRITRSHDLGPPQPGTELPGDITGQEHDRLAGLHARTGDRAGVLGARTADQAPEWAVQTLGPVPSAEDAADRADWQARAGQVAAYREAVGWTHPEQALGQMPGVTTTERRTSYTAAWHALSKPETGLAEADLSEGQLRARVRARDNADAWAPPNVAPALRAAEHKAEQARQAAALAAAEGRTSDVEHYRAEAVQAAVTVDRLTQADEARIAWYTTTLETRTTGDAAQTEADRRGINLHHQPDRTTAEEWLALEAQARLDDDRHRPIIETDLRDLDLGDLGQSVHADQHVPDPGSPEPAADHPAQVAEVDDHGQAVIPGLHPNADSVGRERPRNHAHTTLGPSITAGQVEALAATTALAAAVAADQLSQDTAHVEHEQEDRAIHAWEAGRRRREAAELDHIITTGTDYGADLGAETTHDTGTDYGIDDDAAGLDADA